MRDLWLPTRLVAGILSPGELKGTSVADSIIFATIRDSPGRQHFMDWLGGKRLLFSRYVHVLTGECDLCVFSTRDWDRGIGYLVASAQCP